MPADQNQREDARDDKPLPNGGAGSQGEVDPLDGWSDRLESVVRRSRWFDRVAVVAETSSTQDAAARLSGGRAGLVLAAGVQSSGRGRRGSRWVQHGGAGLPMTFVLNAGEHADSHVSLAAGVAAARAAGDCLGQTDALGIRWPNDVVEMGEEVGEAGRSPGF